MILPTSRKASPCRLAIQVLVLCLALLPGAAVLAAPLDWFLTPDQQGQRLYDRGEFAEAAKRFTDPARIGAALYAARDFEGAAAVFGRQPGPEGAYNRGNALVFLGQYEEAIKSYDLALSQRPDWTAAQENRGIAAARLAALAPPESDAGGTGGMLGADELVVDQTGRVASSDQEQVLEASDEMRDDASLRSLWLRRVDTEPSTFLAAKFSSQLAREESAAAGDDRGPEQ